MEGIIDRLYVGNFSEMWEKDSLLVSVPMIVLGIVTMVFFPLQLLISRYANEKTLPTFPPPPAAAPVSVDVSSYEGRIAQLESERERLGDEGARQLVKVDEGIARERQLREQVQRLQSENSSNQERARALEEQLREATDQLQQLQKTTTTIEESQRRFEEGRRQLQDSQTQFQDSQRQIERSERLLAQLEKDHIEHLNHQEEELTQAHQAKIEEMQSQFDEQVQAMSASLAASNEQLRELDGLHRQLEEAQQASAHATKLYQEQQQESIAKLTGFKQALLALQKEVGEQVSLVSKQLGPFGEGVLVFEQKQYRGTNEKGGVRKLQESLIVWKQLAGNLQLKVETIDTLIKEVAAMTPAVAMKADSTD